MGSIGTYPSTGTFPEPTLYPETPTVAAATVTLVRERAPLRLAVNVRTPSGQHGRLGQDDPDSRNQPQNLTFSTVMPGGFEQMSCALERDPRQTYPDLQEMADVTVTGAGGQIAWEGRLEDLPDTGGSDSQITPQSVGYQAHLDDRSDAAIVFVDQDLTRWQGAPLDRQKLLAQNNLQLGSSSVLADPNHTDNPTPAIMLEITGDWVSPAIPDAETWYDAGQAGGIAKVYYDLDFPTVDAGWEETVRMSDDASTDAENSANLASASEVTGYYSPASAHRYAYIRHRYLTTPGGTSTGIYKAYWRVAVYGPHNLPAAAGSDPQGFLASDMIRYAIGRWAPMLGVDTIAPSAYTIPQAAFLTLGTVTDIVKELTKYELLDWAVWENRKFWLSQRGEASRTRRWRARVGPAQLQQTGPQSSRLWNGVLVTFQDVSGIPRTVGPPGSGAMFTSGLLADPDPQNPATERGIDRWAPLTMGTSTVAGATKVGSMFLQEQKLLSTAGQASLVGHVEDARTGILYPAWQARAGDTIEFTDAADTRARRIVHTAYDDPSKTNTVQLDQPPQGLQAVLERLSVALTSFGLA